jgi:hypothetical protein
MFTVLAQSFSTAPTQIHSGQHRLELNFNSIGVEGANAIGLLSTVH